MLRYIEQGVTEVYGLCDPRGTLLQETDNRGRKPVGLEFPGTYLWWATALGPMLQQVKTAKASAGSDQDATAYPIHSSISPKKLAPETYSNIPPVRRHENNININVLLTHSCGSMISHEGSKSTVVNFPKNLKEKWSALSDLWASMVTENKTQWNLQRAVNTILQRNLLSYPINIPYFWHSTGQSSIYFGQFCLQKSAEGSIVLNVQTDQN